MNELKKIELSTINGGSPGSGWHTVAYAAGYAYAKVAQAASAVVDNMVEAANNHPYSNPL